LLPLLQAWAFSYPKHQSRTISAIQKFRLNPWKIFFKRFPDIDILFPIMDTSVEARAVGCPFEFKENVPVITEHRYKQSNLLLEYLSLIRIKHPVCVNVQQESVKNQVFRVTLCMLKTALQVPLLPSFEKNLIH